MALPQLPTAELIEGWGTFAFALLDVVGDQVILEVFNGVGYDEHPARAFVAGYRKTDLVPGGPIEQADLRALFNGASFPALPRRLDRRDRVLWKGQLYAVMNHNDAIGASDVGLGIELQLRGG